MVRYPEPSAADEDGRLLYRVDEAARQLGISRATLYELLATGSVPSIKIGARRLVARSSLVAWVEARLAAA